MTLALKYRPRTFDELVGQDHLKKMCLGIINKFKETNDLPSCIILGGGHGQGKTTIARLIATYCNCSTYSACGTCASCVAMKTGKNLSVDEIDAGSSGGIDEVRNLISSIQMTTEYRRHVVIIDEAHGLSKEGARALLKTLEECDTALFILCTTEVSAVFDTIKSRSVNMLVSSIAHQDIVSHLINICKIEKIPATKEAVNLIADLTKGHMRDAIQLLESCSYNNGEKIKSSSVLSCSGFIGNTLPEQIVSSFLHRDESSFNELIKNCEHDPLKIIETGILLLEIEAKLINEGDNSKRKFPDVDMVDLLNLLNLLLVAKKKFSNHGFSIYVLYYYFTCFVNNNWQAITRI